MNWTEAKRRLAEALLKARERTRFLLEGVSKGDLVAQHDPIMSPPIWDYGHIGNYEKLWLLKEAHGRELSDHELYDMYDASLHPREECPSLSCSRAERAFANTRPNTAGSVERAGGSGSQVKREKNTVRPLGIRTESSKPLHVFFTAEEYARGKDHGRVGSKSSRPRRGRPGKNVGTSRIVFRTVRGRAEGEQLV